MQVRRRLAHTMFAITTTDIFRYVNLYIPTLASNHSSLSVNPGRGVYSTVAEVDSPGV